MNLKPRRRALSRVVPVLGVLIGISGVAFVIRTLVTRWDEVTAAFADIDPVPLLASVLMGLVAMTIIGAVWVGLLQSRGHHAPRPRAMAWYYVGQLGKYVPGGIWPIVGRAELAVRGGVSRPDAYKATAFSLVSTYSAATVVVAIGSLLSGMYVPVGLLIVVGLAVVWFALGSPTFADSMSKLAGRFTQRSLALPDRGQFVRLTLVHVPSWICMSLSTSITAHAFGADIGLTDMLFITSLSWLVGFLVVGVPGGIGVRESIFTALAGGIIGTPVAISLALVSRVVFIGVDLIGAFVSSLVAGSARASSAAAASSAEG